MGDYLNPGSYAFEEALNTEIFVDKSGMIRFLNTVVRTKKKYVCVSRPRRFGKTMAADMICAYYDRLADSRDMFEKLAVCKAHAEKNIHSATWDCYLGKFDVIRIVMTTFFKKSVPFGEALDKLQTLIIRELKAAYPEASLFDESDLIQTIKDVYSGTGRQVVFVIDEWDSIFREMPDQSSAQTDYLDFLRDLLKDNVNVALAYMTGILPIKRYMEHSALNMFTEYSMIAPRQLAPYCGFTEKEVRSLCQRYGRDFEPIKEWYDGYEVCGNLPPEPRDDNDVETEERNVQGTISLYSPLSVVEAVTTGEIGNYWNSTISYEALAKYIRMNYDGLRDAVAFLMDGGRLKIDTTRYQNDITSFQSRDDVLSMLIHMGYLGYDRHAREVFIPNREILDEFRSSTSSTDWIETFKSFELSRKLLQATWDGDENLVAELLEKAHNHASNKTYNDETALSYGIQLAYYAAQKYYTTILELDSGKGYADIVYIPSPKYADKPVLLIELKYNHDADTALSQIRRQEYPARLEHYRGNILLIGIDYKKDVPTGSKEFKHHSCRIEKA